MGFTSKFKEGREKVMTLPDDDPGVFEVLVECLYTQTFHFAMFGVSEPAKMTHDCLMRAAQLFILADKYDVEILKSNMYRTFFEFAKSQLNSYPAFLPSSEMITYIYTNTDRKAPIRKIITDWFAWTTESLWLRNLDRDSPDLNWLYTVPDFGVDLAITLNKQNRNLKRDNPLVVRDNEQYFEHILPKK